MKLRDLQERRGQIVTEMRGLTNAPAGTGGDLSAEQATKFDALKGELEGLEKRIARQATIDEAERRMKGTQIAGTGDQNLDDELRGFSLRKAICMQIPDIAQAVDCGRERELSQELARRSGIPFQGIAIPMQIFHQRLEKRVVTGAGEGSNIIGTDLRGDLYIDTLRARMVTRKLGARVLSGLVGDVDIPKLDASATASWIADNAALTANDPDLNKLQLSPKTAGMLTEYSRKTLLQSSPDIEQLLRDDFAKVLANTLDLAAINGGAAGTSNEPDGVLQSGLQTVAFGGGATWAKVLQIIEAVQEGNAEPTGWITSPGVVRLLRSTAKVGSTDSVMIMQAPNELAGYPLSATMNAPQSLGSPQLGDALVLGDWTDLLIAFWSEFDLLVNPYESTAYSKGNVQIRGLMSCDIGVRHAASFAASTDVQPG